jgi:diacylglycerol kinase family enzyme
MGSAGAAERRVVVVLNPRAQTASRHSDPERAIRDAFQARGMTAELMPFDGDHLDLTPAMRSGAYAIVAAGGDGTVSLVAKHLAGTPSRLGVLPLGTLNHFARDLGVPLDLAKSVDVIADGEPAAVDLGELNGRIFLNNCSLGVYPRIVKARDALQAQGLTKWPAFVAAAIGTLRRHHRLAIRLDVDGRALHVRTAFVFVANNEYRLAGLDFSSRPSLTGGKLVAYIAPQVRARDLPLTAMKALVGRTLHPKDAPAAFRILPCTALAIDGPRGGRMAVAFDGEVTEMMLPLHAKIRPAALTVFVPRPVHR